MASITATSTERRRRWPRLDPRGRRPLLLAAGLAAFEALIGVTIASSHYKYAILLVFGVAACWLVWRFPLAGAVAMMFLVAGIIYPDYFVFHAVGRTVFGYEVVLIVLLARAVIQPRQRTWGGRTGAMLGVFLAVLAFSTTLAIESGATSLFNAINWSRDIYALAFFWVVIRLFGDRRSLGVLLTTGIVLGAISGVVGVLLAVSGNVNSVFQDSGHQVLTTSSVGSLLRVRMPGLGLGFMLLWVLVLWLARGRRPRWLWWVCLPCIVLDILVSQNRNMWVIAVLGLVLVMLFAGPRTRGRVTIALVVLAAAIAILVAVPQGGQSGPTPLQPLIARAGTILNPHEISSSSSAQDRNAEDQVGWHVATHHLLYGIGPGVPFGLTVGNSLGSGVFSQSPQLFLHDQWLYMLMTAGVPGAVSLVLFFGFSLRSAFIRGAPRESRMLGIGLLSLMLTAIVMLSLTDASFLTAVALVAGAIHILRPQTAPGAVMAPRSARGRIA